MVAGTLGRYFGLRFLVTAILVFIGIIALVSLIEYVELMRKTSDMPNVPATVVAETALFRVPLIAERIMPFSVLVAAMSCFLGVLATFVYNPVAAALQERSQQMEVEYLGGRAESGVQSNGNGFWVRQVNADGQSIVNATTSSDQGVRLGGVTVFTYDKAGQFLQRMEARSAVLGQGFWQLSDARIYATNAPPRDVAEYPLKTSLTPAQVRESFATPETVPLWGLPTYIDLARNAGLGAAAYRLQFHKLIARPFVLASMVLLAAAVSLRFFRFGGVQKMVLSGVAAGFLLYVLSKVSDDLSKAELMHPIASAWMPVAVGGLTGLVALLYQEDG